jgi:hypothetical protein
VLAAAPSLPFGSTGPGEGTRSFDDTVEPVVSVILRMFPMVRSEVSDDV